MQYVKPSARPEDTDPSILLAYWISKEGKIISDDSGPNPAHSASPGLFMCVCVSLECLWFCEIIIIKKNSMYVSI